MYLQNFQRYGESRWNSRLSTKKLVNQGSFHSAQSKRHSNADKIELKVVPFSVKTLDSSKRTSTMKYRKRPREDQRKYLENKRIKLKFRCGVQIHTKKRSTKKIKNSTYFQDSSFHFPSSPNQNLTPSKNSKLEGLIPKHYTVALLQRGRPPDPL